MSGIFWGELAACNGHPKPLWDETVHGETRTEQVARHKAAKTICNRCPVTAQCLAAVDWSIDEGIRGGIKLPFKKTAYRDRKDIPVWVVAS